MKPFLKFCSICSLLVLAMFSCTVQKRLHLPGHHVSWKGGAVSTAPASANNERNDEQNEENRFSSRPDQSLFKEETQEASILQATETDQTPIEKTSKLSQVQDSIPETSNIKIEQKETATVESAEPITAQKSMDRKSERPVASSTKSTHWFVFLILLLGVLSIILLVPGILLIVLLSGTFSLVAGIILLAFGAIMLGLCLYALWIAAVI